MQTTPRHLPLPLKIHEWLATLATVMLLACDPAIAQQNAETSPSFGVELNKLEQTGAACRSYMVLSNRTGVTLDQLSLDLVVFDTDGVIDRRLAVELGPVQAGRTRVKVFDMAGLDCGRVARVLLNDVLTCRPERVDDATTCDAALRLSARGDVDFIR